MALKCWQCRRETSVTHKVGKRHFCIRCYSIKTARSPIALERLMRWRFEAVAQGYTGQVALIDRVVERIEAREQRARRVKPAPKPEPLTNEALIEAYEQYVTDPFENAPDPTVTDPIIP